MWTSERIAVAYFAYLAAACWLRPIPVRRRIAIVTIAALEIAAIFWVMRNGTLLLRQWAPVPTILLGYYASGLMLVAPSVRIEAWLIEWDRRLLGDPATRFAAWPRWLIAAFEIAYMGCFVVIGAGFLILVATGHASSSLADRYWTLVVGAEFGSFAPLAFIQTRPPWAVERKPVLADRHIHDLATRMVQTFTIRANTFPSGHVAGSLAVALAVAEVLPAAGGVFAALALFIAAATIVGRYHYCADVIAGVALVVALKLMV